MVRVTVWRVSMTVAIGLGMIVVWWMVDLGNIG